MKTVLLVRHAEYPVPTPENPDPALSAAGQARAKELARVVGSAGVTAIFPSLLQRARQTAAPLAAQLGLPVEPINQETPAGVTALVERVRGEGSGPVVLVVSHTHTVKDVCTGLGVPEVSFGIAFDNLFVLTVDGPNPARAVQLKYGPGGT